MCSATLDKITGTPLPTRKSVRQLRWFESSFRAHLAATLAQTGVQYEISDRRLVDTFLAWHRAFDSQKPASRMVRRDYVSFAAGMMFHELLGKRPVSVQPGMAQNDPANPALFRPEQYLYASYCHLIRQAILGQDFWLDTRRPDRLDDPAIWLEYSDSIAQDRAAAIAFLDLFANEQRAWSLPKMITVDGGFGNRLWTLAEHQTDADRAGDMETSKAASTPVEPGLRLVSNRSPSGRIHLPAPTRLVLIAFEGVAARTETIDSEELSILLNEYNVKLQPEQTRDRFFGQPLSAAMTYVAEHTGQLCPGGFIARLDQRLINRDKRDLVLRPGVSAFLKRLKDARLDAAIVSHGRRSRVEAGQYLPALSALQSVGPVHMLDPDCSEENGLEAVANSFGHSPRNTILIDASSVGIGMARHLSMPTFGFATKIRIIDRNALIIAGAQAVVTDLDALIC